MVTTTLSQLLKQHFGYSKFRPLQENIIKDVIAGRDVFALLPTGGGKSLCYQLPAMAQPGLTVIVSPLIALMKDQVDGLKTSGIPATFLNSSLTKAEYQERVNGLEHGQYKLLYLAPERVMMAGFIDQLIRWNVTLLAIDEAHCISEWGHDFRPEYRQMAHLRQFFPRTPILALTATATARVKEDVIKQLQLNRPSVFVASFNRHNLNYRVEPKVDVVEQIAGYLSKHKQESGIVYCFSRASTDALAKELQEKGFLAKAYHAGMDNAERTKVQEEFLNDTVRVICATIAFGMGVNKPNVRFVLHHDMPRNIEGYYQETGRAGRDGMPSECILYYSGADIFKARHFIEKREDPREREIGLAQLNDMVNFAKCRKCRRVPLLGYFGEEFTGPCGNCDNCQYEPEGQDATIPAQKLLSCVFRIREQSGFATGLNHVVDVLLGSKAEKVLKWNHNRLSTYGIGKGMEREEWLRLGEELVHLGLLDRDHQKFNVVQLTDLGRSMLASRAPITVTARPKKSAPKKRPAMAVDELLLEQLKELRSELAKKAKLEDYLIFSDVALRHLARDYPLSDAELIRVPNMSERKVREFGPRLYQLISEFLKNHPRQNFDSIPLNAITLNAPTRETLRQFNSGMEVEEIASVRKITIETVFNHLTAAVEAGEKFNWERVVPADQQKLLDEAFAQVGSKNLTAVLEKVGRSIGYSQMRLYRAVVHTRQLALV